MTEGRYAARLRALIRELRTLAATRAEGETTAVREGERSRAEGESTHQSSLRSIKTRFERDSAEAERSHREKTRLIREETRDRYERATATEETDRSAILEKAGDNDGQARKHLEETIWVAETVYEANEQQPATRERQALKEIKTREGELDDLATQARDVLRRIRQTAVGRTPVPTDASEVAPDDEAKPALDTAMTDAHAALRRLRGLRIARLFRGWWMPFFALLVAAGAGAIASSRQGWTIDRPVLIAAGAGFVGFTVLAIVLYVVARRRTARVFADLTRADAFARAAGDAYGVHAAARREAEATAMREQRDHDITAARAKYEPIITEIGERRDHHLARIAGKYPALLEELVARGRTEVESADAAHTARLEAIRARYEEDSAAANHKYTSGMKEAETASAKAWHDLERSWKDGMTRVGDGLTTIARVATERYPGWDDPGWSTWRPPRDFAPSVPFGWLTVDRRDIPGGIPKDERLFVPCPETFTLPATLDFPDAVSLLLLTDGPGRDHAVDVVKAVMLRLLTTLPPGKVRFTIIDPVGLGENFAGFMHLADYNEQFVTSKIWTDPRHIEQRLVDLTEHMETVIQKYLRNEFETIAEYNELAGEIAEPYRFLIISDFPVNFTETAVKRLASVVTSGPRCGVYTLIAVDRRQALPKGLALEDLVEGSTTLEYKDDAFVWRDEQLADVPLTLEPAPPEPLVTRTLKLVGEAARDATRVEVPFGVVAPKDEEMWSRTCDRVLEVPLGRAGATKLQMLEIGLGTSQHVLIAGKTGSGKSTLLHVLITNLALWYSPDEVQFYLIDFKKGVEFKTYGRDDLPHARAVAVESDREFGLSVLERIDRELKQRGETFRTLGVQDLAGYRRLEGQAPLPRILLVIDEFQELFVEDDKIGQDAALLMDRLVRQGRAFGVHVLLGSQTLGGAYTLARSTMGQMQVRIALQCSEADSYLIMSDDNAAARLLSRPGEAIYNDAGGAIEGNSPFQIVWLNDEERDDQLARVTRRAQTDGFVREQPLIVFEGHVAATLADNHQLRTTLETPSVDEPLRAWMGEAIAIKGPTAATFRRQSGCNLLMVGQRDEAALAMIGASLLALAAQRDPDRIRFVILDGSPADSPNAGFLERLADGLPHLTACVPWRGVDGAIAELAGVLTHRRDADETDAPAVVLLIHALHRFRMLRTTDEFGMSFGSDDGPPATDRLFGDILRDGPPLGIHTISWCDTATNLNRTLDRHGLREFESRVLFQMSGADSTQLIDTPAAAKLGLRRALFFNEETGTLEKFRPYALPSADFVRVVHDTMSGRHPDPPAWPDLPHVDTTDPDPDLDLSLGNVD